MFKIHLWKSDILSKDAGHRLFHRCFSKHFASKKKQLPGLSVSGTLVENELKWKSNTLVESEKF